MRPPSPFPSGVDLRSYRAARTSHSCQLRHTLDGGTVTIPHTDRDGAQVDETEAAWLTELARGLDQVSRVWGNEWHLGSRETAVLLEHRLAASADLRARHVSLTAPENAAALLALARPMRPSGFVSWTFTGLPGDPQSDLGQLNARASGAGIEVWALRYAGGRELDSGWLESLVEGQSRRLASRGEVRCWRVSEPLWGRIADAALHIPPTCWSKLTVYLNV